MGEYTTRLEAAPRRHLAGNPKERGRRGCPSRRLRGMAMLVATMALLSTVAATASPVAAVVIPPTNDDISTSTSVTALPFDATQDSLNATSAPSDPTPSCGSPASYSVWYSYTPTINGTIQAS